MQGVFTGFTTIAIVIAVGALLAHLGIVDLAAGRVLSQLAFFVGSPALMALTLGRAEIGEVLSGNLIATAAGVLVCALAYAFGARFIWRRKLGEGTVGALCASYVNAGNLGIPIASYVLGDAALVAPTLLLQMLVLQPLALALLDADDRGRAASAATLLTRPLRNPPTVPSPSLRRQIKRAPKA